MKKKHYVTGLVAVLALGLAASVTALAKNPTKVAAEQSYNDVISDDFNNVAYANGLNPGIWDTSKSSASVRQGDPNVGYLYTNNGGAAGDYFYFGSRNKISGITSIQFDYKFEEGSKRWMVLQYLTDSLQSSPYDSTAVYTSGVHFGENYMVGYNETSEKLVKFEEGDTQIDTKIGTKASEWVTVRFDVVDATHATVNFKAQGGTFDPANAMNLTDTNPKHSLTDAYVGFQVSAEEYYYYLDNLVITTASETITEDFANFDLVNGNDNFGFIRNNNSVNTYALTEGIMNPTALAFGGSQAGDYALSLNELVLDTSISKDVAAVDCKFNVSIPSTSTEKISIVFGVDGDNPSLTQNTVVYEMSKDGGLLREYSASGTLLTEDAKNVNVFSGVTSGKGSTLNIVIFKNGKVSITENGSAVKKADATEATFQPVYSLEGHIAVAASSAVASGSKIAFDDLKVLAGEYYVPVTKSVTHNFSNDYWGNEGYEDFYLRNPSGATSQSVSNGRLVWAGVSDGTFFGSAHQYDCFIMDFKLMTIKADLTAENTKTACARNRWIGIDLSRSSKSVPEYGSYLMAAVEITKADSDGTPVASVTPWLYRNNTYPGHADLSTIKTTIYQAIPNSLFTAIQYSEDTQKASISEEDAVCFRYISDGTSLTLQLKKACEREFVSYAKWENLILRDYFTISCTGWTYLEIDDFSMANTSTIYTCADNYVPETETETVKETVYDPGNVDVNLNDEIRMNTGNLESLVITMIVIASVCALVGLVGFGFGAAVLIKTKKGGKNEKK